MYDQIDEPSKTCCLQMYIPKQKPEGESRTATVAPCSQINDPTH